MRTSDTDRSLAHGLVLVAGMATALLTNGAHAQTMNWNNAAGGAASTAANWNPVAVPSGVNDLVWNLASTYTVSFNASTAASRTHLFRRGIVTLTASSPHTVSTGITIGDTNALTGTVILSSGTLNSTSSVTLGTVAGSAGVLNVTDDSADFILTGAGADLTVGVNGPGTLSITSAGLVQVGDQLVVGSNSTADSTLTVSGAQNVSPFQRSRLTVLGTGISSKLGQGGNATVNISSGALASFAGDLVVSNGSASTSVVTLSGVGGIGGLNHATLDVAGDLLLGRNTTAGSAGGTATMNVNNGGTLQVDSTLFLAGDPDGGSATLHTGSGGAVTAHSLDIGVGSTLDLDGGSLTIDAGTLTNSSAAAPSIGGTNHPVVTLANNAAASLPPFGGIALRVGSGAGTVLGDFDVRSGSDLSIVTGNVVIGDTSDTGSMIINGAGSTMSLPSVGSTLIVGNTGVGHFQAELGAAVSGRDMLIAASVGSTGTALFENPGTTAAFERIFVGGSTSASGGDATLSVNAQAALSMIGLSIIKVWPNGVFDVSPGGIVNGPTATITVLGDLSFQNAGEAHLAQVNVQSGGRLRGHPSFAGSATLDANVNLASGATLELINGDLTVGNVSNDGFVAQIGSVINVGAHALTLLDADGADIDTLTIAGGTLASNDEIKIANNGSIDGTGTIQSNIFFNSGGSVITATGANGITINGTLRNNSGTIDGTKFTFNGPGGGWTGAGAFNAQIVFNSGAEVNALANMTIGNSSTLGVTFNAGSQLHADRRTVTLLDSNGVGLPSVTDLSGGHVVCAQPLVVNNGRRLSGRGGSIDTPTLTIHGRLSPGELAGEPAGETGELTINGNLILGVGADTDIEIGGLLMPIDFDRVVVTGTVFLGGALNITDIDGFHLPSGQAIVLMQADSISGSFSQINAPADYDVFVGFNQVVIGHCPADYDGDGTVDFFDYDLFVQCFETFNEGVCANGHNADFNLDGAVDFFDYDAFVQAFEAGCS